MKFLRNWVGASQGARADKEIVGTLRIGPLRLSYDNEQLAGKQEINGTLKIRSLETVHESRAFTRTKEIKETKILDPSRLYKLNILKISHIHTQKPQNMRRR